MLITVSGKLPPGKFPPIKLPPGKFPPIKFPPGIFPPMFLNIPIQVFKFFVFFHYCHRHHWYYLKDLFSWSLPLWIFVKTFHSNYDCQRCHYDRSYRNIVLSLVISDYFHKRTNQPWVENSKVTGLKRCKKYQEK